MFTPQNMFNRRINTLYVYGTVSFHLFNTLVLRNSNVSLSDGFIPSIFSYFFIPYPSQLSIKALSRTSDIFLSAMSVSLFSLFIISCISGNCFINGGRYSISLFFSIIYLHHLLSVSRHIQELCFQMNH